MSKKIDSIIWTTLYTELMAVIDVFKCEKCGHMYVEGFRPRKRVQVLPLLQSQGR